jgi:hypothetical protein
VLQAVAMALGGRAGARLTGRLACSASRSTLLRLIREIDKLTTELHSRLLKRSARPQS